MFQRFAEFFFLWGSCSLALLMLPSCTKENFIPEGGVRVHLPLYQPGRDYEFQEVVIQTLRDLPHIRGEAAEFYHSPRLQPNYQFEGVRPVLRFFYDPDHKVVPTDALSLKLLTLYYHFENLMFWDRRTGVALAMSYPRQVAVEARTKDDSGNFSANNARYFTLGDSCIFESYTLAALPTVVNAGVIAHEHFHAIFQRAVLQGLRPQFLPPDQRNDPDQLGDEDAIVSESLKHHGRPMSVVEFNLYHQWMLRAVNEALADVWGWLYAKDRNFVARSIPGQDFRSLTRVRGRLNQESFLNSILFSRNSRSQARGQENQNRAAVAYRAGAIIAQALAEAARVHYDADYLNDSQALEFSQMILEVLPQLKAELNSSTQQLFSLGRILTLIFSRERENFFSSQVCEVIRVVLTSPQDLAQLCHSPIQTRNHPPEPTSRTQFVNPVTPNPSEELVSQSEE
jgi:hypothetical protein